MMDFEEFKEQYEAMHPGERPSAPERVTEGAWMRAGIAAMFICSAGISGVHTIPTIYSTVESGLVDEWIRRAVSIGSFFAVELGILLTGYGISESRTVNVGAGALAIIVAVIANIISVSKAFSDGTLADIAVSLILGVFAPTMALLAGKAFEGQRDRVAAEIARRKAVYYTELEGYNARVAGAYDQYTKRMERKAERENAASKAIPMEIPLESERKNSIPSESTLGHRKAPDASERVNAYLTEHPEALAMDGLELARVVGVGKSTAYTVLKEWKTRTPSTNGSGDHA